jgi:FkbM family methyltransferase
MLNPSAISNRTLSGKVLRLPLRLLPKGMAIPILRGPSKGQKWIVGSSNHGCWLGTYELEKQAALERFIKPGMTVYDIGAQAGFYTLLFSRLVGLGGPVYAFEPFAENLRYLVAHIAMNRLSNVKVVQVALASRTGVAGFTVGRGKSQNALVRSDESPLVVATMRLDELVEDHGFSPPDLMKLDVEGAEASVLDGARPHPGMSPAGCVRRLTR